MAMDVTPPTDPDALRAEVAKRHWFHSIDLGNGVTTPGTGKPAVVHARELSQLRLPNLAGKSVLDIGAWDGFYTFAAERAGAQRVVSLDHYVWSLDRFQVDRYEAECRAQGQLPKPWHEVPGMWHPDTLPGRRGYDLAHAVLKSKAEPVVGDFMSMDLDPLGTFDVVLYLGVLYHMENPLASLRRVAKVTKEMAIVETDAVEFMGHPNTPLCEFFPSDERDYDPTNWWAPNFAALSGLCKAAGFSKVVPMTFAAQIPRRTYRIVRNGIRWAKQSFDHRYKPDIRKNRYRLIAHAYK